MRSRPRYDLLHVALRSPAPDRVELSTLLDELEEEIRCTNMQ